MRARKPSPATVSCSTSIPARHAPTRRSTSSPTRCRRAGGTARRSASRTGRPDSAKEEFARKFGVQPGLRMLEQYGKLLFDTGRDPESQLVHRQLLALHADAPAAALDQTRLLILAQRGGKRRDLLSESKQLVEIVQRVRAASHGASVEEDERYEEANRLGEEA